VLLVTIARRIQRLLARRRLVDDSDGVDVDPFADDAPTLAGLAAESVRGVSALGPGRGDRCGGAAVRRCGGAATIDSCAWRLMTRRGRACRGS